jgi:choline dehydrogenase-like flavoprotein
LDPKTETRSYVLNTYNAQSELRKNYHLLPGYKVCEITFDNLTASGVTFEARNSTDKTITTVKAKQEVILAAGTFNSPVILQRSGVGPKDLLKSAGIEVKLDLPGVGQNLQDHAATLIAYTCKTFQVLVEKLLMKT